MTIASVEIKIIKENQHTLHKRWIYSNELIHAPDNKLTQHKCALGRIAHTNQWGIYCKTHLISLRLFPNRLQEFFKGNEVTEEVLVNSLLDQLNFLKSEKKTIGFFTPNSFRLVHGDSDGIPGIIIDDYNFCQVIQSSTAAGDFLLPFVVLALKKQSSKPIYERSAGQTRTMEGLQHRTGWVNIDSDDDSIDSKKLNAQSSEPQTVTFAELEMSFILAKAQKTGLFLDQRDNLITFQSILKQLSEVGITHKKMLDLCCYLGSWSAAAASQGVSDITIVDQDQHALNLAEQNITRNFKRASSSQQNVSIIKKHTDMFDGLSDLFKLGERYHIVIADPPAFAKSKKHVTQAKIAYSRMIKLSSKLVLPHGILVLCSCSRNIEESEFKKIASETLSNDDWVLIKQGNQSADHTISSQISLSAYLKCLFYFRRSS